MLIHFNQLQTILTEFSKLIDNAEHPVNLGSAREALISNFLSTNLTELISFHTGEIFDTFDQYSGQLDIVLHPKSSPKLNLFGAINLFPLETVLAAIEVKSTLNTDNLPFFQKYNYQKNEFTKIELIKQRKSSNDKELKKYKNNKSNSSLAGALETCYKVKRLNKSNNSEKIPYILFVYNYKGTIKNIIDKISHWIKELEFHYSKIYFSQDTFDYINSENELKNKFDDFKNKIFVDETVFLNAILNHFKNENFFNKKNDFFNKYIYQILEKVKTEKFHISEILHMLPDRILILNNFDGKQINKILLKVKTKTSLKTNDFYELQRENILYELFCYINKLSESWFANQEKHHFPASEYTNNLKIENYIRLNDFFTF